MEIKAYPHNSLKEFIENPMGKGSTAIMQRQLILNDMKLRIQTLIRTKSFSHNVYLDKDVYYIHVIIPSESERDNTYDVVFKFIPMDKTQLSETVITRYGVQFFSNCPSFTFTFAYAFKENDMMIDILENKYDKITLTKEPIQRNPYKLVSYEKSTTMAALYILSDPKLMSKIHLSSIATRGTRKLINDVRTTDHIKLEVDTQNKNIRIKKREEEKNKRYTEEVTSRSKTNRASAKVPKTDKRTATGSNKIRAKGKVVAKKKIGPTIKPR